MQKFQFGEGVTDGFKQISLSMNTVSMLQAVLLDTIL